MLERMLTYHHSITDALKHVATRWQILCVNGFTQHTALIWRIVVRSLRLSTVEAWQDVTRSRVGFALRNPDPLSVRRDAPR